MQEVTFTLQTITPLFMAGADQKKVKVPAPKQIFQGQDALSDRDDYAWQSKAEIRPTSLRGLMRYWQRALVGGLAKTNDQRLKQAIEAENKVFGTTDRGSTLHIKVSLPAEKPMDFTEQLSRKVNGEYQATGKGYLLWSMSDSGKPKENDFQRRNRGEKGRETKYKPPKQYYDSGVQFEVTLSTRGYSKESQLALQQAVSAMWLLTQIGGIGARSRRCAGSLSVINVKGSTTNLSFNEAESVYNLQQILQQGIDTIRLLWGSQFVKAVADQDVLPQQATFDILSIPNSCRIWILQREDGKPWETWEEAMNAMGGKLQAFRSSISEIIKRTIFGLPLIIRGITDQKLRKQLEENRRASPLLLRVTKLQGRQYVGIAVLFKTNVSGVRMSDYSLIERWIAQYFPDALEVKL